MHIDSIIIEIEEDFKQYKASGLMDRTSIYRWVYFALKKFGPLVCERTDEVVDIRNGSGTIDPGFYSLIYASKCSPKGYYTETEDPVEFQNTLFWKERVESSREWQSCNPCSVTEKETTIVERVLINNAVVEFYYEKAIPLTLAKSMDKKLCAKECRNLSVRQSPYEITINKNTVHTNFSDGKVYMEYYTIPSEDGLPVIKDTPKGELVAYIESYIKKKIIERVASNGDDPNAANLLAYWTGEARTNFNLAMSDLKWMTLNHNSMIKMAKLNRAKTHMVEILTPRVF